MITILFITFCFYLVAELINQGTEAKARKREAARQARIEAEMRRDREERERVAREQREQREALLAHEKALREMHLAQLREEKQRLKLEAEQARQAAVLRKHEEQLNKLTAKVEQCEEDILQWQNQREQLIDYQEYLERERDACIGGSKQWHKWNNKCLTNNNKVYGLDTRIRKAYYTKAEAERKISVEAI